MNTEIKRLLESLSIGDLLAIECKNGTIFSGLFKSYEAQTQKISVTAPGTSDIRTLEINEISNLAKPVATAKGMAFVNMGSSAAAAAAIAQMNDLILNRR